MKFSKKPMMLLLVVSLLFLNSGLFFLYHDIEKSKVVSRIEVLEKDYNETISEFHNAIGDLKDGKLSKEQFEIVVAEIIKNLDEDIRALDAYKEYNVAEFSKLYNDIYLLKQNIDYLSRYIIDVEKNINDVFANRINANLLRQRTLYPTVRIRTMVKVWDLDPDGVKTDKFTIQLLGTGSGSIVYSRLNNSGLVETYILTCSHLYDGSTDPDYYEFDHFDIEVFDFLGHKKTYTAFLIKNNSAKDTMVLKLDENKQMFETAKFVTREEAKQLDIFEPVLAVGCGLSSRPYPGFGVISGTYLEYAGIEDLWQVSAPIIYGNSGGGLFVAKNGKLFGIVSRGAVHRGVMQNHMGYIINPITILDWLEKEGLSFIVE